MAMADEARSEGTQAPWIWSTGALQHQMHAAAQRPSLLVLPLRVTPGTCCFSVATPDPSHSGLCLAGSLSPKGRRKENAVLVCRRVQILP